MTIARGQQLLEENDLLRQENRLLRQKMDYLIKKYFGGNKSEKMTPGQLELLMAGMETPSVVESSAENPGEETSKTGTREKKAKGGRRSLPSHLETEEIVIEPPEVKESPESWKHIGNEVTEELDLIPSKFIKRLYIRRKYVSQTQKDLIVIGDLPNRWIDKGIPGVGLLSHVILSKFADHLPLYRQEKIFAERYGVEISRKRMADWMRVSADWFKPIYEVMRRNLIQGDYLQVDETPIRYLDRDEIEGSRQGYLWSYGKPGGDVVFDWRTGRSRDGPEKFLGDFKGLLQADGYSVYGSLARQNKEMTLIGCWAHARRKFVEALDESPRRAGLFVRWIGHLYQTERHLRKMRAGHPSRLAYRQSQNAMTLSLMEKTLQLLKPRVLPQSMLGKAIGYALGQWECLKRAFDYGEVEIDNNRCENSIRPSALGKKNWLFVGHPDAGWRTAVIYSILGSCRRHGIEPQEYLTDVLTRLPNMKIAEVATLTPSNWKASRSKRLQQAA